MKVYLLMTIYTDLKKEILLNIYINKEKAEKNLEYLKKEFKHDKKTEFYITEKEVL